jgi:precorrin-2 dehydrogenase/sirohydrochlorin ferrochelatase
VVRRGALQIAVSTTGHSPALAQRLRKELEGYFVAEYEDWLASLGQARAKINAKKMKAEERKRLLHEMVSREAFEAFLASRRRKQR